MKYSIPAIRECSSLLNSIPCIIFDSAGHIQGVSPQISRHYPVFQKPALPKSWLDSMLRNPSGQPFLWKLEEMGLYLWGQYQKLDEDTFLVFFIDFKQRFQYEQDIQETSDELANSLVVAEQYKDKFDEQSEKLITILDKLMGANEVIIQHNDRITKELEMASRLQVNLLPKKFPFQAHFAFASKYQPSLHLGGDFFDGVQISDHEMMIVVADVSGHGVSSSLITTMFKMVFHSNAAISKMPDALLKRINIELIDNLDGNFITLFVALIDTRKDEIIFSNAGHPPIMLLRNDGRIEFLRSNGMLLGLFEEAQFGKTSIPFCSHDTLLLYTDGIIESSNIKSEFYASPRLESILLSCLNTDVEKTCQTIYQDLIRFTQNKPFEDDISLVVIEKK